MINERLYGRVSDKGKPLISGMERFHNIFSQNKGKKLIMEITILEGGTTNHHIWYIMKMIVPVFIEGSLSHGHVINHETALEDIQKACGIFDKPKGYHSIFDFKTYKPDCDLSPFELEVAIKFLHAYCLSNFNIIIGNTKIFKL